MLKVVVAIVVLLGIVLIRQIPKIGGNIHAALLAAGVATMLCAGMLNPGDWLVAWVDGINRIAWIMALSITGGIFAEISQELGTVDTIIGVLNAKFGQKPRALIVSIIFVLVVAGSLLGDAVAAATVIGALTIGVLVSMNIKLELISAIIVMGASLGSIMPPMTQAIALASTLAGANPDTVMTWGYLTTGIAVVVCCLYVCIFMIHKDNKPGANPNYEIKIHGQSAGSILKANWKSLIPVTALVIIVLMRTVPAISIDLGPILLNTISLSVGDQTTTLYDLLKSTTILGGLTNGTVLCIVLGIFVAYFFPSVRKNSGKIWSTGMHNVMPCVSVQLCAAFMLGCFYAAGHRVRHHAERQPAEDRRLRRHVPGGYAHRLSDHHAERHLLLLRPRSGGHRCGHHQGCSGRCKPGHVRPGYASCGPDHLRGRRSGGRPGKQEGGPR